MKVHAAVAAAPTLSQTVRASLFAIFDKYYDGVSWEQFNHDLDEKDHVILLRDHYTRQLCGFSTIVATPLEVGGRPVIGVFSGDTVLEKAYWGSPALGLRFLGYLFALKLRHPLTPVYWFLISKGFKTFLLMAKNFVDSYPRRGHPIPAFEQALMDRFYRAKYGSKYRGQDGLITFRGDSEACRLRQAVAPITQEMCGRNPDIAYFVARNPHWEAGDELACIAKMTLSMPLRYFIKKVWRPAAARPPLASAPQLTWDRQAAVSSGE